MLEVGQSDLDVVKLCENVMATMLVAVCDWAMLAECGKLGIGVFNTWVVETELSRAICCVSVRGWRRHNNLPSSAAASVLESSHVY
jgi:hypothetical protein